MLLRPDSDGVLVVGQASHAWLAGQLARRWAGLDERREEVLLAATQHDIGMAEWDREPELDAATGHPVGFLEMALPEHLRLWRAAPGKVLAQSVYAAVLVAGHGRALYRMRDLDVLPTEVADDIRAYVGEQTAFRDVQLARLGADPALAADHQRLLLCWDAIALALPLRWGATDLPAVPARPGRDEPRVLRFVGVDGADGVAGAATIDPWPFDATLDALDVVCEARRLTAPAPTRSALAAALAEAPLVTLRFRLARV